MEPKVEVLCSFEPQEYIERHISPNGDWCTSPLNYNGSVTIKKPYISPRRQDTICWYIFDSASPYEVQRKEADILESVINECQKMLVKLSENTCPTNDNTIVTYGAFYLGALTAANKLIEQYISKPWTGENKVYRDAEIRLITKDKRSMQLFLDGVYDIMYRNHERNAKGKLIRCEAYFADRYKNFEEVK